MKKDKQQTCKDDQSLKSDDCPGVDSESSLRPDELDRLTKKELYQRVKKLQAQLNATSSTDNEGHLGHELQVHQIELDMQNGELREAQHELELTRDRYADLYDFSPISYITFNDKGVVKNINLTGANLLGEFRSSIVDKPFLQWVFKEDITDFFKHIVETLNAGKNKTEIRIYGKNKTLLDARLESIRSWDKESNAYVTQSAILDVTETKRAQNDIALKARQLRLITDSLPSLIAYLSCHELHLFANKAYVDCFAELNESLLDKPALDVWGEKNYSIIKPNLDIAYMGKQVSFDMELKYFETDKKYVNVILVPDFDVKNIVHGVIILIGDITERLTVESMDRERLLNAANFARQSNMGELASEIAHELNQPLAAIAIYSDACRRMIESENIEPREIIDRLKDISEQTVRAGEVIRHIREFVNKKELQLVNVSLNDLVNESLDLLKVEMRSHNVELSTTLEESLPLTMADKILIEQVILNLVRNAIEAMDSIDENKRLLNIETAIENASEVGFKIEDSGPGLSSDEIKLIFEPFHTTKKHGMGLGLAISKSIIDAHYGKLWAVPANQGGTVFSFTLPVISEE